MVGERQQTEMKCQKEMLGMDMSLMNLNKIFNITKEEGKKENRSQLLSLTRLSTWVSLDWLPAPCCLPSSRTEHCHHCSLKGTYEQGLDGLACLSSNAMCLNMSVLVKASRAETEEAAPVWTSEFYWLCDVSWNVCVCVCIEGCIACIYTVCANDSS